MIDLLIVLGVYMFGAGILMATDKERDMKYFLASAIFFLISGLAFGCVV